jgi:hypothetical protein
MTRCEISTLNKKLSFIEKRVILIQDVVVVSLFVFGFCLVRVVRLVN